MDLDDYWIIILSFLHIPRVELVDQKTSNEYNTVCKFFNKYFKRYIFKPLLITLENEYNKKLIAFSLLNPLWYNWEKSFRDVDFHLDGHIKINVQERIIERLFFKSNDNSINKEILNIPFEYFKNEIRAVYGMDNDPHITFLTNSSIVIKIITSNHINNLDKKYSKIQKNDILIKIINDFELWLLFR